MNITETISCDVALKEWSATCAALRQGRQIILLRKGGLLDENGVFALEHNHFWLLPTQFHQDSTLVQPAHRDLLNSSAANASSEIALQLFAQVTQVWALDESDAHKLRAAPHIWSQNYLDVRFAYKPEHPLLCVALRCFQTREPQLVPSRPQYFGCRSWIELETPLNVSNVEPVLDDAAFGAQLARLQQIFDA